MNRPIMTLASLLLLTACSSIHPNQSDLMHHHWVLESLDGRPVQAERGQEPDLEIGENFTVNGIAGCNRYFGMGNLEAGRFWVTSMGNTEMACLEPLGEIEQAVLLTLQEGASLTLTPEALHLAGKRHTLRYRLEDWK
ncbi:META domain-containing protein [Aeromonas diversa]|uniref:Heat shock protein HslJ n=1 Tax=Aeromonas diversa CDC 2478-85 TaxID=1268237 RepID=N9VLW6_9GAMM|nr:META domain-containing protein [Aeromonas diversa]ENY72356.1 heat shock protein HslJ [Aeromonas diversa CDC 2478-85]